MPDIAHIIETSLANAWLYLPIAVALGAVHALEPGHAKSLMAAYIVAIRGSTSQAITLALAAAVGHTIVVWALAILALLLGEKYIVERAEPWLLLLSGILLLLLGMRLVWSMRRRSRHAHDHGHAHRHGHGHDHHYSSQVRGQRVGTGQIIWFGFTGGLLPCPSAIAVLLICIHLGAFTLGIAMVAAFSIGLALTLVTIGVVVAWGTRRASGVWPWLDQAAARLPYLSAALIVIAGFVMTASGLNATGLIRSRD
jgi:nickel/cobalt transporter (NicO) family protein